METQLQLRSSLLLDVLSGYEQIWIITHDTPDPDAISAGWALHWLVEQQLGTPVRLIGGGDIVRAENRHMVKLLGAPIELVEELQYAPGVGAVLVDCGLGSGNNLCCETGIQPVAVIDHHQTRWPSESLPFVDIRPRVAASATIVASYLREQGLKPNQDLATALLYAIRTETRGGESFHSGLDRAVISWLTWLTNPSLLAEIENAPLARAYFGDLVLALQNTFIYDNAALCFLPKAQGPEIVGEVADLIARCDGVERVLCAALVDHDVALSVRTGKVSGSAAELVQQVVDGIGHGGGHQHRAGGKIPEVDTSAAGIEQLFQVLRSRWLAACGIRRQRGRRLVAKREIVEHL